MADEPETETETTDDGETNWARMEEIIDRSVSKHVGALDLGGALKGVLDKWSPAEKNSPESQKDQEPPEEKKPGRSESTPRRKGIFSEGFFKGL